MPLRILKRSSKQYNVVSKSTFVISVELLDNGIMECTLDADSSGTDCLLNISQRLGLHQPEFFGLRYISRGVPPRQRWVELERPLKKQLEKHAQDSQLSLGVMYYVGDVNVLKDETARYHYFLQLKSDVIDGKLNCSIEQAISLAAYSLQAEFGDYDPERHTIEYLRDFAILPKDLNEETYREINIDALYETVARQYGSLIGFPPPIAEIYYIMVAQQLDGYGQEAYPAKDDSGNDILICVSANGLVIRRRDWTHIAVFRWSDIKSLLGHKRLFVVESAQSQRTMQFHFTDPEVVKYVRKMCLLQTSFHKESLKVETNSQNHQNHIYANVDKVDGSQSNSNLNLRSTPDLLVPTAHGSGSHYQLNNNFAGHGYGGGKNSPTYSGFNLHNNSLMTQQHFRQPLIHRSLQELSHQQGRPFTPMTVNGGNVMPIIRPNLGNGSLNLSMNFNPNGIPDPSVNMDIQSLLPAYRAAPDYDTAVQMKYSQQGNIKGSSQLYYNGQEDEEEPIYQNEIVSQMHSIELRERDNMTQSARTPEMNNSPRIRPQLVTHTQTLDVPDIYIYKPPPPYPGVKQMDVQRQRERETTPPDFPINNSKSSFINQSWAVKQAEVQLKSPSSSNSMSNLTGPLNHESLVANASSSDISLEGIYSQPYLSETQSQLRSSDSSVGSRSDKGSSVNINTRSIVGISKFSEIGNKGGMKAGGKISDQIDKSKSTSSVIVKDHSGNAQLFGKTMDPNILKEFLAIPKTKANPVVFTAMKKENCKGNRFPNVVPYEDNLIRLGPTRHNQSGYINASPVSAHINGRDWKYIIGQLPLAGYASAVLWQMIWETDAKIIASLERDSSVPFYPIESGSSMSFGDFQVVDCKSDLSNSSSIARELILIYLPKKKQRRVWMLPYEEEWKDDVPIHTEHFLCFLEEVNSIQRKVSDPNTPLTVLCGTGAGRSGVLVLSDLLLHAADSGHKLRCDSLLGHLRTQRMLLVSSASQYAFVLHTLAKYLAQSRLI